MLDAPSFGPLLKRLRATRDLTQEALAEQIGCAVQTMRMLETGRRRPSRDLAERIADVLALPPAERADFVRLARLREVPSSLAPEAVLPLVEPVAVTSDHQHRLPVAPNPLIGRQEEHERVRMLLEDGHHLVTLAGLGGVGKSRLALQLGYDLTLHFRDGVVWVALAPVLSAEQVVATIAGALGLVLQGGSPPVDQLLSVLRAQHVLLVLDNFEHVLEATPLIARILAEAPQVYLLVTSRERLRLQAEWVVELGGLAVHPGAGDEAARSPAALLFVDRARRTAGTFALDQDNIEAVVEICRRLDGLPLALELAAARVKLLPPPVLLQRLDRALPVLAGGARDLPERQRTMRATLQWSYDLLPPDEQAMFRQLAVFRGGWTLPAAEVVGAGAQIDEITVLDLLANLNDKSLVIVDDTGGVGRYRMLEPVRQYAAELLTEAGEAEMAGRQHASLFLALAEQAKPLLRTAQGKHWLAQLDTETDNLRAALIWWLDAGEWEMAARFGWALRDWWWFRSKFEENNKVVDQLLAHEHELPYSLRVQAWILTQVVEYGRANLARCEQSARKLLELSRQGDGHMGGAAIGNLGIGLCELARGEYEVAIPYIERSLPQLLAAGEDGVHAQSLSFLGTTRLLTGDVAGATKSFEQALEAAYRIGDQLTTGVVLFNLAQLQLAQGDYAGAEQRLRQVLLLAANLGDWGNVAFCLEGLAVASWAQTEDAATAQQAARWLGAAEGLTRRIGQRGHSYYQPDRSLLDQTVAAVRAKLGIEESARARAMGIHLAPTEIVTEVQQGAKA